MASPKSSGRMIRKDVSRSHKIASLSERAGFLFFMLIPHLNSYGKMNGSPHYIKGEVVPLIGWFTVDVISKCLQEVSDKTNVKWFDHDGMKYLHSINWEDHQKLEEKKRGNDELPSYNRVVGSKSPTTSRLGSPEVEVEVEVKVKETLLSGKPKIDDRMSILEDYERSVTNRMSRTHSNPVTDHQRTMQVLGLGKMIGLS